MIDKELKAKQFFTKAAEAHNGKYDYSQFEFRGENTKGIIICPEHGPFLDAPRYHVKSKGCKDCVSENRRQANRATFISRATERYGNKYDYSEFVFVNVDTPGIIRCTVHEHSFLKSPYEHIKKSKSGGCSLCVSGTLDEFVTESRAIHGDDYDYSQFKYVNRTTEGVIVCKNHGPFKRSPIHHTNDKRGCKQCSVDTFRLSPEEFVKRVNDIKGDIFDLADFKYTNVETYGVVRCRKHDVKFEQSPAMLFKGTNNCPDCQKEEVAKKRELFVSQANEIHKDKYDYSNFKYVNQVTEGIVICEKHGEFPQTPHRHVNEARGCRDCAHDDQRKDVGTFIEQANEVHKSFYSYESAFYKGARKTLQITCPIHGKFPCSPDNHLRGKGCPKCALEKLKKSYESFLTDARVKFGDKFEYSNVDYKDKLTEIEVICSEHGPVLMTPQQHLASKLGCHKCSGRNKRTQEEWIQEAIAVHGGRFDYSKTVISEDTADIIVICVEHGEMLTNKYSHLRGTGCRKCQNEEFGRKTATARFKSNGQFKVEAILKNAEAMYDYTPSSYTGARKTVEINCLKHGPFTVGASKHIHSGHGCQVCNSHRGYKSAKRGCLYVLQSRCERLIKIGISNNPVSRFSDLRTNHVMNDFSVLSMNWNDDGQYVLDCETEVHKYAALHDLRAKDLPEFEEIFSHSFDGYTEWFVADKKLLDFIDSQFFELAGNEPNL